MNRTVPYIVILIVNNVKVSNRVQTEVVRVIVLLDAVPAILRVTQVVIVEMGV